MKKYSLPINIGFILIIVIELINLFIMPVAGWIIFPVFLIGIILIVVGYLGRRAEEKEKTDPQKGHKKDK